MFTTSVLIIGPLLAVAGDAGLAWGLPLYSVFMLAALLMLRRETRSASAANLSPTYSQNSQNLAT
jgi:predicted cobalt transporter CbtA